MAKYDPAVIQKFADRLYFQANTIIVVWTILGAIVGAAVGGTTVSGFLRVADPMVCVGITAVVMAIVGCLIGQTRAFHLKFMAQQMLCLMQIETNTRYLTIGH